jgi:hypothetical protein
VPQPLALLALFFFGGGGVDWDLEVRIASASIRAVPKTVVAIGGSAEAVSTQEIGPRWRSEQDRNRWRHGFQVFPGRPDFRNLGCS